MIKEHREFFLYILGILAMFIVFLFLFDYLSPGSVANSDCGLLGLRCSLSEWFQGDKVYDKAPAMWIDTKKDYTAIFYTDLGEFEVDLYEKNAPITVNNFVFLVRENYFDGVLVHRVVGDFLIQSGDRNTMDDDPENDGKGGPGYTIKDEINWSSLNLSTAKQQQLENLGYKDMKGVTSKHLERKSIAMANSGPNSNGSQFFIVIADTNDPAVKNLEGRHTVFGKVISGWDIVVKISNVVVDDPSSNSPKPVEDIKINDIKITVSEK